MTTRVSKQRRASGSVTPYKDGHRVWVTYYDETGKQKRLSEVVKGSKRAANDRLAELLADIRAGRLIPSAKDTLGQFVKRWWPGKAASISPTTARGYRNLLDLYILPDLGSVPIQKIKASQVSTLIGGLQASGRMGQADHVYVLLKLIFNSAIKDGALVRNPIAGVPRPQANHYEITILSPEDWQRVRDDLQERQSWALLPLTVLITTGLRRSELAGLRWTDFDPDRRMIVVHRSYHRLKGGKAVIRQPKTHRSRRAVALDPHTSAALEEHRRDAETAAQMLGRKFSPSDYIFARLDGSPWPPGTYSQLWYRLAVRLGLKVRLHDLRHSAASLLLAAGVDVKLISTRLGHSSTAFTMDVYAHLMPDAQAEAADKLAALLNRSPALPQKLSTNGQLST